MAPDLTDTDLAVVEGRPRWARLGDRWQAGPVSEPAARIRDLVKTYGSGDALVRALPLSTVRRPLHRDHGAERVRQIDAHALRRALDRADSGTVHIGDEELGKLGDRALTRLRRTGSGSSSRPTT
jgi:putative ABC transport system ATP-binding protein